MPTVSKNTNLRKKPLLQFILQHLPPLDDASSAFILDDFVDDYTI